jgi:hypothetical protein
VGENWGGFICTLHLQQGILHYAFHIRYLKKNLSNEVVTKMEIHLTDEEGKTILELEGILEVKGINLCSRKIRVQDQMEGPLGKGGHVEVESMVEHSSLNML